MNIQIFGTGKSSDSRKAERYFKERGIRYQFVDMKQKGLSRGESDSVLKAAGPLDELIDEKCGRDDLLSLIRYLAPQDKARKVFENREVLTLPIVRNGKKAAAGYRPEIRKEWT